MASTAGEEVNQKAIDNAMFKKLEELTIKMPTDHTLYESEVDHFLKLFQVEFEKVQGDTMKKNQRFGELLIFLARSLKYFPDKLGWVPAGAMKMLEELGSSLHPYNRRKCAGSVMILRAKGVLLPVETTEFLLRLMRLEDKELRGTVYKFVLNDLRKMEAHHKNKAIKDKIRDFIGDYLPKHADKTSQRGLRLLIDLYKRNIWTDKKTINVIAESCFNPSPRTRQAASHFLMETTMPLEELPDSDDDDVPNPTDIRAKKGIARQTKAREKQLEKEKRKAARKLRKKEIEVRTKHAMPIDQLNSPQAFAQRMFELIRKRGENYAHKLVYVELLARVMWRHQLVVEERQAHQHQPITFYDTLIGYLKPSQKEVARVMIALAESVHEFAPENEIEIIVWHIINHFVNDRCSEMTMTIGLNTLREIFKKLPSVVSEQMMGYLATYYDYKNKNVSRAAKSVINFIKEYNPQLLPKKFRTRVMHEEEGEEEERKVHNRIPGAELLEQEGDIPIQMDRILTDQDFKRIRKLRRKMEEKKELDRILGEEGAEDEEEMDEEDMEMEGSEMEEEQGEGDEQEDDEEEEGNEDEDNEEDGEESEEDEDEFGEEEEESELDFDGAQELEVEEDFSGSEVVDDQEEVEGEDSRMDEERPQPKSQPAQRKKRSGKKVESSDSSSDEEEESEEDDNPHGFIQANQIAYYKMSKGELKAAKGKIKEEKPKYKHKPKEKKGGTTNKEKSKLKPLMMVRAKKNKIRSNEKQLKTQIKHLKNKLGKVRSGKQAKRMKTKKINKAPKKK